MFPEIQEKLRWRKLRWWYRRNDLVILKTCSGILQIVVVFLLASYGIKEIKAAGLNQHALNGLWALFVLCWVKASF